jgi:hypothetical protein
MEPLILAVAVGVVALMGQELFVELVALAVQAS